MTTKVTITGTGTPIQTADRAGPGVLVETDAAKLQFDAGRGTVMRLAAAGSRLTDLDGLFITHHHSDHIVGIPDLLMTRWLNDIEKIGIPDLPIHVPDGPAVEIIRGILEVWEPEMEMRRNHTGRPNIAGVDVRPFNADKTSTVTVGTFGDTKVSATAVEHSPVEAAVAYRVDTPDGSVVISGDTDVCPQVEELANDCDVLVHEAIKADLLQGLLSNPKKLLEYHTEPHDVGALAARARVKRVILTHLVPPPGDEADREAYAEAVREGGFTGELIVADDLSSVTLG